jgi:transposase
MVVLEIVSTGLITRLLAVMAMVERLVPDGLWELFQRVVPATPVRPQGGGRRRYGDREVLAAIVFVATTRCTWRQLPSGFGPSGATAHRRFTESSRAWVWGKLHRLVLDELGARGELDWSRCAIDSVNMRAVKGGPDGSESRRSWQEGVEDPLDHRAVRSAPLHRHLCCEHP